MNLIDRDKLINERPEYFNEYMDDELLSANHRGWNDCNKYWREIINGQPTVNEWIPVSEPPKEYGEYWIKTKHRYGVAEYLMCPKKWADDDGDVYGVIAWKPIEPYEVDND